jgi:hypothetical protein
MSLDIQNKKDILEVRLHLLFFYSFILLFFYSFILLFFYSFILSYYHLITIYNLLFASLCGSGAAIVCAR